MDNTVPKVICHIVWGKIYKNQYTFHPLSTILINLLQYIHMIILPLHILTSPQSKLHKGWRKNIEREILNVLRDQWENMKAIIDPRLYRKKVILYTELAIIA